MQVKSSEFILSAVSSSHYPKDNLPDIAIVGRSNVGKSSLINTIVNRKSLAKTSSTPGKTRGINFYRINNRFYLVDLPGYGFAKASRDERRSLKAMVEEYFSKRENIKGVLVLLDVRHKPDEKDINVFEWLKHTNIPVTTVITKVDKISRNALQKHIEIIKKSALSENPVPFSAITKTGKIDLLKRIECYAASGSR
ncbi:MAG: YihA family ribosome biogenesis GTP-binding protein [Deltaproteobacteria bacterium GWC2_42_11]|nr:MAG: YihA family ribosome biogenesis GTP-binding protein [Deltaproteobacteria bacterium GWC2_42_11]HBO83453.1 YihA family ribosome biogenesis GTP-binding protein [Deltaproteobacteria bacterium]